MNHSLYVDGGSDKLRFGVELSLNKKQWCNERLKRDVWGAGAYIQYTIGNFIFPIILLMMSTVLKIRLMVLSLIILLSCPMMYIRMRMEICWKRSDIGI